MNAESEKVELSRKKCKPCEGNAEPMKQDRIEQMPQQVEGWQQDGDKIRKTFEFENFYQTVAFVNAVAWIANKEDHHPDLEVSYKKCVVNFSTHAVGGLSDNDFISAAKVDDLVAD